MFIYYVHVLCVSVSIPGSAGHGSATVECKDSCYELHLHNDAFNVPIGIYSAPANAIEYSLGPVLEEGLLSVLCALGELYTPSRRC